MTKKRPQALWSISTWPQLVLPLLMLCVMGVAGCSGDSSEPNQPGAVTGLVISPVAGKCRRDGRAVPCNAVDARSGVFNQVTSNGRSVDADNLVTACPPSEGCTDSTGVLRLEVSQGNPFVDANSVAYYVLAAVDGGPLTPDAPAIGGLFTFREGALVNKDFTPATQIACVAGAHMPKQDATIKNLGCKGTFPLVSVDAVDDAMIARLEAAAAEIAADVIFPGQQGCAACAVINSTDAGSKDAAPGTTSAAYALTKVNCE